MTNIYGISEDRLMQIRKRDKTCVYCYKKMTEHTARVFRGDWWTIEHLNHFPPWDNPNEIAICCWSCNASRGRLTLAKWFRSSYCIEKRIKFDTVAKPIRDHIQKCKKCKS